MNCLCLKVVQMVYGNIDGYKNMSYYENKSKEYLKVAEMIHTQQFFSVVPHNAYYSCFLLMQHLFYNKYNEKL